MHAVLLAEFMVRIPRGRLTAKFTIGTSLVLLITIALFAYLSIEALSGVFFKEAQDDVETLSEIILKTTHLQMLQDNRDVVYRMIDDAGRHEKIARIRLFDGEGRLRYSTHASEIGHVIGDPANACAHCHCDKIATTFPNALEGRRVLTDCTDNQVLSVTTSIPNQPACYTAACHAHSAGEPILGALEVQASLKNIGIQADVFRRNVLSFALSLLLILIASMILLTQNLVIRPVHSLLLHARKVSSLELDTHVDLKARDEIGELASEFNEMTDHLRQSRDEFRQLTETLEAKVQARSRELAEINSQMMRSEKLASLGQLVAGIAHEINNPLTGIQMFANLLADDPTLPEERREDALVIVRETQRCAAIVRRLLEFSRNSIPSKRSVSLAAVMDNALALIEHQANLGKITFVRRYAGSLPSIEIDPDQIEQVYVNMIVNACQAMPKGGELTAAIEVDGARGMIVSTIADTGAGIADEHLTKIFDPFFTTKDQAVNGVAGTGLGLSVSYGIVQNHGGTIAVRSQVGKGTVFTVELPLGAPSRPAGAESLPAAVERGGQ